MPPILPAVTVAALLETAEDSGVSDIVAIEPFSFGTVLASVVVTGVSGVELFSFGTVLACVVITGVSGVVAVELFSFGVVPVLACVVVTVGNGSGVMVEISEGHESAFSSG